MNIFRNSPRIIWEKFSNVLGSGEELDEIQIRACSCDLEWGNVNYLEGNLKGIGSHDERKLNANYPKMSRFRHKFREKIATNL